MEEREVIGVAALRPLPTRTAANLPNAVVTITCHKPDARRAESGDSLARSSIIAGVVCAEIHSFDPLR